MLVEHLVGAGGFRFGDPRQVTLKGISMPQRIVPMAWT